jgi:uncharacterized protein with von Willebrand factor type A (vWA) domain
MYLKTPSSIETLAVRYEYDAPRNSRLALQCHRLLERRKQLGPSAAALLIDKLQRSRDVLLIRGQRTFRERRRVTREENDVEKVRRAKLADEILEQLL